MTGRAGSSPPVEEAPVPRTLPAVAAPPRRAGAKRLVNYALGIAIAALWGASFPMTKAALDYLGPMGIAFVRWAISAAILLGWVAMRGKLGLTVRLARTDGLRVIWLALTGITFFYALENLAINYTTATNAGILSNLTAVFMVLIAVIWFGERLRPVEWLALAMAFLGAGLVSLGAGHVSLSGTGLLGDLLMIAATLFAAIYSVGSKRVTDRYPADVATALIALAGAVMLLPLALHEGLVLAMPVVAWAGLLVLGVGAGALANLWWLHLLSYMDASRAGMILFLIPVFSTVLAVAFLGEPLTVLALAGGALVLAGVAIMQRKA